MTERFDCCCNVGSASWSVTEVSSGVLVGVEVFGCRDITL